MAFRISQDPKLPWSSTLEQWYPKKKPPGKSAGEELHSPELGGGISILWSKKSSLLHQEFPQQPQIPCPEGWNGHHSSSSNPKILKD